MHSVNTILTELQQLRIMSQKEQPIAHHLCLSSQALRGNLSVVIEMMFCVLMHDLGIFDDPSCNCSKQYLISRRIV